MNAPLKVRIKEGCRGGREQFQWNSIKEQDFKDREQYLGATVKVGMMGKFGRYQLHDWYNKKRDTPESIVDERANVQAYEEELMKEALGLKPKKLLLAKKQLSEEELKEVLKRDADKSADKQGRAQMGPQAKIATNEHGEQVNTSNEEVVAVAAREAPIKGLGFAMHRTAKLEAIKAETLGTEGQLAGTKSASSSVKLEAKDEVKDEASEAEGAGAPGVVDARVKEELREVKREHSVDAAAASGLKRDRGGEARPKDKKERKEKKDEKKRKKAEKKLRKIEKKLKKAAKQEKKAAKKMKKDKPSSSSSSSSS